ncbi:MAG: hypothetical protein MR673_08925 [Fusobacterium perfoetens]|uniref:hypothetical protein n=1 Tax=Fusobacterium perfoetens TaxID=852 RepID=UPI0023F02F56|nr:hypothetical protein [Fusobacterium perfoetens]MCI6153231.1 hypothetical protein [Fusobacterium perfoetens]MDY3238332.1 hypothetical protein [Fusobacterium perfoetens]
MILEVNRKILKFKKIDLIFIKKDLNNLFSLKNNKTLFETLQEKKYKKLNLEEFIEYYNYPLGKFLEKLKLIGNNKFELFLNKYGDREYCKFKIIDKEVLNLKGLYLYCLDDEIVYIGRCLDSFYKRINIGYGNITPKNCYKDGQQTNCHINSLINKKFNKITFWICSLENVEEIKKLEIELIKKYNPQWNGALKDK